MRYAGAVSRLVGELARLPGIGSKTAGRAVFRTGASKQQPFVDLERWLSWSKARDWKSRRRCETVSRVRIPLSPPTCVLGTDFQAAVGPSPLLNQTINKLAALDGEVAVPCTRNPL